MKNGTKQDEAWINPVAKQLANLGFSVSTVAL